MDAGRGCKEEDRKGKSDNQTSRQYVKLRRRRGTYSLMCARERVLTMRYRARLTVKDIWIQAKLGVNIRGNQRKDMALNWGCLTALGWYRSKKNSWMEPSRTKKKFKDDEATHCAGGGWRRLEGRSCQEFYMFSADRVRCNTFVKTLWFTGRYTIIVK